MVDAVFVILRLHDHFTILRVGNWSSVSATETPKVCDTCIH